MSAEHDPPRVGFTPIGDVAIKHIEDELQVHIPKRIAPHFSDSDRAVDLGCRAYVHASAHIRAANAPTIEFVRGAMPQARIACFERGEPVETVGHPHPIAPSVGPALRCVVLEDGQ